MKPVFAAGASAQHVLGFETAPTIGGRDGFDRFNAGKLLCHAIGLVVLDDVGEPVQSFRRRLDEQFSQAPGANDRAGLR